jgi:hypothetical protein
MFVSNFVDANPRDVKSSASKIKFNLNRLTLKEGKLTRFFKQPLLEVSRCYAKQPNDN